MKSLLLSVLFLLLSVGSRAVKAQRADYDVIPLPRSIKVDSMKVFNLSPDAGIYFDAGNPEVYRNALFLREWVDEMTGIALKQTPDDKKAAIKLSLDLVHQARFNGACPNRRISNSSKNASRN